MKSLRNCVEILLLVIMLGVATFSQRFVIIEWFRVHTAPPLPKAVEYGQVSSEQGRMEEGASVESEEPTRSDPSPIVPVQDDNKEDASLNVDVLPASFNLAVPFTPQAPDGDWGEPYKEACEEASLYMVDAFYQGTQKGLIPPDTADSEIKKLVSFEMELFGDYKDTTADQTATLAEAFYGYGDFELMENPTIEQIKSHVAAGHPVIVPAAGRLLGNPFFTAPGPIYHMLVVRGYTADGKFITNDPGTRRGEGYVYDFDTLMNAMHDWNAGEEITEGKKVVLVVYPG